MVAVTGHHRNPKRGLAADDGLTGVDDRLVESRVDLDVGSVLALGVTLEAGEILLRQFHEEVFDLLLHAVTDLVGNEKRTVRDQRGLPEFDEVVAGVENPRIVDSPVALKRPAPPRPQVLDIKGSGIAFGEAVRSHEPGADSNRIKEVFGLLTNNAERTVENLVAATKALEETPASAYDAMLAQLVKENQNAN